MNQEARPEAIEAFFEAYHSLDILQSEAPTWLRKETHYHHVDQSFSAVVLRRLFPSRRPHCGHLHYGLPALICLPTKSANI